MTDKILKADVPSDIYLLFAAVIVHWKKFAKKYQNLHKVKDNKIINKKLTVELIK